MFGMTQQEMQEWVDKAMRSDDPREREACQRLINLGHYPQPSWMQKPEPTRKWRTKRELEENLKRQG